MEIEIEVEVVEITITINEVVNGVVNNETDPFFQNSVAAGISQTDIDNWNASVDVSAALAQEIIDRLQGDIDNYNYINNVSAGLSFAIGLVQTSVTAETSNRIIAINNVQAQIDAMRKKVPFTIQPDNRTIILDIDVVGRLEVYYGGMLLDDSDDIVPSDYSYDNVHTVVLAEDWDTTTKIVIKGNY